MAIVNYEIDHGNRDLLFALGARISDCYPLISNGPYEPSRLATGEWRGKVALLLATGSNISPRLTAIGEDVNILELEARVKEVGITLKETHRG